MLFRRELEISQEEVGKGKLVSVESNMSIEDVEHL